MCTPHTYIYIHGLNNQTYTFTHTYTIMNACKYCCAHTKYTYKTHVHIYTCIHTLTNTHICTHIPTHVHTRTHLHNQTHTYAFTCSFKHAASECTHTYTHSLMQAHRIYISTHILCTHIQTRNYTSTHILLKALYTCISACTFMLSTYTCTYMHNPHTHIHQSERVLLHASMQVKKYANF